MFTFLLLLILGVAAGVMAGFFGVGGGLLFSPLLFFLFTSMEVANPVAWTIGTSLFCTFTAAFSSTVQQYRQRNSYVRVSIAIGLFGAAGVYAGKFLVTEGYISEDLFVTLFIMLLLFVSVLFYRRSKSDVTLQVKAGKLNLLKIANAGGLGGLVASLAGVGGGVVLVPVLNLWYRLPIAKAVSISSLAIVLISFSGWMQYAFFTRAPAGLSEWTIGYVDFGTSLPLVIGSLAGGVIGVKLNKKAGGSRVQLGFAIMVLIISFTMIWTLI